MVVYISSQRLFGQQLRQSDIYYLFSSRWFYSIIYLFIDHIVIIKTLKIIGLFSRRTSTLHTTKITKDFLPTPPEERVVTPWRKGRHWLTQVQLCVAASGPLGVELAPTSGVMYGGDHDLLSSWWWSVVWSQVSMRQLSQGRSRRAPPPSRSWGLLALDYGDSD